MRRLLLILLSTLALAGCGGTRQPPPWMRSAEKPRDENYHGGNAGMILKYDADHDGTLTRAELIAGLKAEFAAHDTHHNGCLDSDQAAAINQERVDAAANNGHLTRGEDRQINHEENAESRQIYQDRH